MESTSVHLSYLSQSIKDRSKRAIPYVGYAANANLGDVELFNLFCEASGLDRFSFRAYRRGLYSGISLKGQKWAVVGGGTLMFAPDVLEELEALVKRDIKPVFLGTGVPDHFPHEPALEKWKNILRSADEVNIRGTHSQAMLSKIGIPSKVLGDLGYLLNLRLKAAAPMEDYAVVVVRAIRPTNYKLFSEDFHTREKVAEVVRSLKLRNIKVKLLAVSIDDYATVSSWRNEYFPEDELLRYDHNFDQVIGLLSKARAILSMRLHPGIFGLALGTKVVELEARQKFHDSFSVFPDEKEVFEIHDPSKLTAAEMESVFMRTWEAETGTLRSERFGLAREIAEKQQQFCRDIAKKIQSR